MTDFIKICSLLCSSLSLGLPAFGQQLRFESTDVNIGMISEDDEPKTYLFNYVNAGNSPVSITRIETTCGCAQPRYSKASIAPKEKGEIAITFYPLGRSGQVKKSVSVFTTETERQPAYRLTLTGEVKPSSDPYINYPYAIGPLRLMQTTVFFRDLSGIQKRMMSIEVANSGDRELKLHTEGLPGYLSFTTNPAVLAPESKGDLIFIISPSEIGKNEDFDIEFTLEGIDSIPQIQKLMRVKGFFSK